MRAGLTSPPANSVCPPCPACGQTAATVFIRLLLCLHFVLRSLEPSSHPCRTNSCFLMLLVSPLWAKQMDPIWIPSDKFVTSPLPFHFWHVSCPPPACNWENWTGKEDGAGQRKRVAFLPWGTEVASWCHSGALGRTFS